MVPRSCGPSKILKFFYNFLIFFLNTHLKIYFWPLIFFFSIWFLKLKILTTPMLKDNIYNGVKGSSRRLGCLIKFFVYEKNKLKKWQIIRLWSRMVVKYIFPVVKSDNHLKITKNSYWAISWKSGIKPIVMHINKKIIAVIKYSNFPCTVITKNNYFQYS